MSTTQTIPTIPQTTPKRTLGCALLFFVPFFAVGIVAFIFGTWQAYEGWSSKDWTCVQGIVTHSEIESHTDDKGSTTYGANIAYTYPWAGQMMTGDKVRTYGRISTSGGDLARETTALYPVGKQVNIFVNPTTPKKAVLEPGLGWPHLFLPGFGLAFGGFALIVLWALIQARRKQKTIEQAPNEWSVKNEPQKTIENEPQGISWEPLKYASTNFQTYQLSDEKEGVIRVVPTFVLYVIVVAVGLFGIATATSGIFFVGGLVTGGLQNIQWVPKIAICGMGVLSLGLSILFLRALRIAPIFDFQNQTCSQMKTGGKGLSEKPRDVPFSNVMGLQIIRYVVFINDDTSNARTPTTLYQLNLVTKDLTRFKIMASPTLYALEESAQTLVQLLRVPIWKRV